jgi:hypothetical protein
MKIKIDEALVYDLAVPDEINAEEFLVVADKVRRLYKALNKDEEKFGSPNNPPTHKTYGSWNLESRKQLIKLVNAGDFSLLRKTFPSTATLSKRQYKTRAENWINKYFEGKLE